MKFVLLSFLIVLSCSSGPKEAPQSAVQVSADPDDGAPKLGAYKTFLNLKTAELATQKFPDNKGLERWRKYRLAMLDSQPPQESTCNTWLELSNDKDFPLSKLATLRWQNLCSKEPVALPEFSGEEQIIFEEYLVERALIDSAKTEDTEDDTLAILNKAKLATHFQDREKLYKEALEKAKKTKNTKLVAVAETALYKNSPRLNSAPKDTELMSAASDHRVWRNFDAALKIYRKIAKSKKSSVEDQYSALKAIRQTYKTAERREDYVKATAAISKWAYKTWKKTPKDFNAQKRLNDSQVTLARTLWTEDRTNDAIKTLAQTEKWLSGIYPMDEVHFIRSKIFEEKKDNDGALASLKKAVEEKTSLRTLKDKILWSQAWLLYKSDKFEEALTPMKDLSENAVETSDKVRSTYWLGRIQLKLSQTEAAKETFQKLQKDDPLGFYGLLAHRELNEKITPILPEKSSEEDTRLTSKKIPDELKSIAILSDWLVAVGENTLAEKALNRFSELARKASVQDEDIWLKLFAQYAQTGSYLPLFSTLNQLKAEVRESLLKSHPEILFPQPYKEVVDKAATESEVPGAFIYAIMRQESAFNPKARSPVDAYGLMQLLPSVAKTRAEQKKLPFEKATDLFDPHVNVPLGAFELRSLMEKYNQQYILAVSGYNANDKALRGWLKFRFRLDPLEFIEEVPYEETRSYIKLVLRNYIFYLRFQSSEGFPFPESCLRLSQKL